jgi:DNA-binding transcriptional MerR regulator
MRIGELARQSGIGISAIKYYIRMGLLPPGTVTGRNQAEYGPTHLRRLRLVDALVGLGGMTVTGTRTVIAAAEDVRLSPADLLEVVDDAFAVRHLRGGRALSEAAGRRVAAALDERRWRETAGPRLLDRLTEACAVAGVLDLVELWAALDRYAAAAAQAAECDFTVLSSHTLRRRLNTDPADPALREALVVVAVLGAVVQSAMSGLARRETLTRRLPADPGE